MSDINHAALVDRQEEGKLHLMFNLLVAGALAISAAKQNFPEQIQSFRAVASQAIEMVRPLPKAPVAQHFQKD